MGWNTSVVLYNDSLHMIRDDPEFGRRLHDAAVQAIRGEHVDFCTHSPRGGSASAGMVIETHHADQTALIAVGGNYGNCLGTTWGYSHHEKEQQLEVLRRIADQFGYSLRKKPERKS